ncbi:MAG TPA: hypothetical protein VJL58_06395 [Pyrinomonadaceae bacterium]|nr:hypothetical protein [Pyrinomonadaceae bacterium]
MTHRQATTIVLVVYGACFSISGQESGKNVVKPFLIWEIRSVLSTRSKIAQSDESFNEKLVAEIERRKVDFLLKTDDEKEFRSLGANDSLIRAIKNGVPAARVKRLRQYDKLSVPYSIFTAGYRNYKKRSYKEIKIAIEAGKKFLKLAGNDPEFEPQVTFVKAVLPKFEQRLANSSQ